MACRAYPAFPVNLHGTFPPRSLPNSWGAQVQQLRLWQICQRPFPANARLFFWEAGFRPGSEPTQRCPTTSSLSSRAASHNRSGLERRKRGRHSRSPEQPESCNCKQDAPVARGPKARTGSTLLTRYRSIQSSAKEHNHVRSNNHEPRKDGRLVWHMHPVNARC